MIFLRVMEFYLIMKVPLRGETFVTKKIVKSSCKIKLNKQKKLILGNLYAKRDWGHAEDYVEAMWKILQYKKPEDFVICTGNQYSIKNFINLVAKELKLKLDGRVKVLMKKHIMKKINVSLNVIRNILDLLRLIL